MPFGIIVCVDAGLAHPWFVYELGATLAFTAMLYDDALRIEPPGNSDVAQPSATFISGAC